MTQTTGLTMIDVGLVVSALAFSFATVLGIFLMAVYFSGKRSDKINRQVQDLLDDMSKRGDDEGWR